MKTKSTPNQIKAKLGLHGVSDPDTAKALMAAYNGVLNNPAYPNPPVDMPGFKAAIDAYTSSVSATLEGGKAATLWPSAMPTPIGLCDPWRSSISIRSSTASSPM